MEQRPEPIHPRTEALERYCPHIGENVVLLRTTGETENRFSCLRAESCRIRETANCIDVRCCTGK